ncbi:MAG: helix-turn-helix domain-containing GNAT family N-acetyltransferase [Jiangellaceae bacterium]
MTTALSLTPTLAEADATAYAEWFACLADPTRVRVLHVVATAGGETTVGHLAQAIGISQSTCSHHVRKLADVGYVHLRRDGTATRVSVNQACCTGLPHAADAVMGALSARPSGPEDLPTDVTMRTLRAGDWPAVRAIYGEGIATRNATFETSVPGRAALESAWLPGHRWVAEIDGTVAGWATITRVSSRACYAGVGETSVYVGEGFRGRGVGTALLHRQVTAADAGELWTLQTSIFPENRASLTLHHSAGFRTIGVRERIARLDGVWRDTILLERRSS